MNATIKKTRRDYRDRDGKKLPGVTSVISTVVAKPALMFWAAKEAAIYAVDAILAGGARDEVIERARKAHITKRDKAADAGTLAHDYVETYLRTGACPPEDLFGEEDETQKKARACFERFKAWWPTSGYEVVELELPLVDVDCGYGGTIDQVLRRKSDGALIVGDLKTGRGVYDDVLLQLGAYSLLLNMHGMAVDGGVIIHAPVEDELRVHTVEGRMLGIGAAAFAAAFQLYRALPNLKLNLDNVEGSIP
jgi:hypothetical protein